MAPDVQAFQSIESIVADVAATTPNAIALETEFGAKTYAELLGDADGLAARFLAADGHRPRRVGILSSDRTLTITAALAALRAGFAFVPFDIETPSRRLGDLLAAVRPAYLVVDEEGRARLDAVGAASDALRNCVIVASGESSVTGGSVAPFHWHCDDEIYVYFTSGSTGSPKGIRGRACALTHYINWEIETFDVGPGVRVSQFIPPYFDPFLRDIFVPLCAGGTVVVPPHGALFANQHRLVEWVSSRMINLIHCTPSIFALLARSNGGRCDFDCLEAILVCGERMIVDDVRRWRMNFGDHTKIVNLYGPTECTMTKFWHVLADADVWAGTIPIGTPMRDTQAIVLDKAQRPCATGEIGELYVGSQFLTLGYLDETQTRERFVANPLDTADRTPFYRTGDRVRLTPAGVYEFIGRTDNQVKIRGQRVELEDIEFVLTMHPQVNRACVVPRKDESGFLSLAAYVSMEASASHDTSAIRRFCEAHRPGYMVPASIEVLEDLPLTRTGKIDREALAERVRRRADEPFDVSATDARSETESTIVALWCALLGVDTVGVDVNFFEIGGESMTFAQLTALLEDEFAVRIPLAEAVDAATVRGMAGLVERARSNSALVRDASDSAYVEGLL